MKKVISLLLTVFMLVTLAACGGNTDTSPSAQNQEAKEPVQAYFIPIAAGGAAWGSAQQGFEDACKELGWEYYSMLPKSANALAEMAENCETALTSGADVMIGTMYSADTFSDVLTRAREKGVIVATNNCYLTEELENFWIGTEPVAFGIKQAETLVKLADGKEITAIYIQTGLTSETQNEQYQAMCDYLKDYPNITIFGQDECNSDPTTAYNKIDAYVKANPEINAIVCQDSYGASGIATWVEEHGVDDYIAIGIDDSEEILNFIITGGLDCTLAQNFYAMGYESIMNCKKIMDGETVPFDNDSGSVYIDMENIDSWAADKGYTLTAH